MSYLVLKNLEDERAKLLADLLAVDKQLPLEGGKARRKELLEHKARIVNSYQQVKGKIKAINVQSFSNDTADDVIAGVVQSVRTLQSQIKHLRLLIADRDRRMDAMRDMARVPIPDAAIPDDFETWRRECYDYQTSP